MVQVFLMSVVNMYENWQDVDLKMAYGKKNNGAE